MKGEEEERGRREEGGWVEDERRKWKVRRTKERERGGKKAERGARKDKRGMRAEIREGGEIRDERWR